MLFACLIRVRIFTFLRAIAFREGTEDFEGGTYRQYFGKKGAVKITEGRMQVLINYSRICNIY